MNQETKDAQEILWGRTANLLLPSGKVVTIREQNGNDDDVLSNPVTQKDLTNQDKFIQGIVIKAYTASGRLTDQDVMDMLIKDKYFIMFASRIHSMGEIVKFTYDWGKEFGGVFEYEDDISKYIWDYTKDMPSKDSPEYCEYRLEPYIEGADQEQVMTLSSGKVLKYNCLRVRDEKKLLKLERDQMTKNRELLQRDLKLQGEDGTFIKVVNFQFFSKRDMIEMHREVNLVDSPFAPITEIESPKEGVEPILFPIISSPNFFFPEEI